MQTVSRLFYSQRYDSFDVNRRSDAKDDAEVNVKSRDHVGIHHLVHPSAETSLGLAWSHGSNPTRAPFINEEKSEWA